MKNKTRNRIALTDPPAHFIEVNLKVRISKDRWDEFNQLARNLGLTHDQLASAIIETDMEGDEGNPFEEIGFNLTRSITGLYPEHESVLGPLRDAFVTILDARAALHDARQEAGAF